MTSATVPARSLCRFCDAPLLHTVLDLGMSPPCESYLRREQLNQMEAFYPLLVFVCHECFLMQLEAYITPDDTFTEYAYFSSYSQTWLDHARAYVELVTERFGLGHQHFVLELASNDGYLLRYFVAKGIPVLGIEPAANTAEAAKKLSIPTLVQFFGSELAGQLRSEGKQADLIVGNNVLAQVPDLNDFVRGIAILLKPAGAATLEFPHLVKLVEENQFDTIYHEHFSYFSFITVQKIFAAHGLTIFDVEELPTHGGSLRIYARHEAHSSLLVGPRVSEMLAREHAAGLTSITYYSAFAEQVRAAKRDLLEFLIRAKREGKTVAGYGAPGKGNTLLNYCGIRTDLLDFTVDRNPYKQGKFLPGTHIPICPPEKIREARPDYLLILPWNFREEIIQQESYIREWGGQFVVPIPRLSVCP